MDRRHQDLLTNRLEDAQLNGCSHMTWDEIYRWYDVEKIAARTWRDIEERWQSITENTLGQLMKIEGRGGIYIFGKESAKPADENNILNKL